MPLFVPAVLTAGTFGLMLLTRTAQAEPRRDTGPVRPPPPPPPPPPGRKQGPYPTPPPGVDPELFARAGRAVVVPYCVGQPAKCRNGLLVHASPTSTKKSLLGPEDSSSRSIHANTGDVVVLLEVNVPDQTGKDRLWAHIVTPVGSHGFVSQKGPGDPDVGVPGFANFTNIAPPQGGGADVAGYGDMMGHRGPYPWRGRRYYARYPWGPWDRRRYQNWRYQGRPSVWW
jgi:hypothetical protein